MKKSLEFLFELSSKALLLSLGLFSALAAPVSAAEEISLIVGGPGLVFDFSIDDLATFAETGEPPDGIRLFARFVDEGSLTLLNRPIPLDVVQTDNLLYSTLGRDLLQNFGKVVRMHPEVNGYYGLRGAMIGAAAQAGPEGWTVLDVLRQFPSDSIDIRLQDLLALRRTLSVYFSYNRAVVAAIQGQSAAEAQSQTPQTFSDLAQLGPYGFEQDVLTLTNSALRQTTQGIQVNYDFTVKAYLPQGLSQPAPVVIVSHGFGDVPESFTFIAEHLASHGFVVMVPNHVGSNLGFRQNFLEGFLNTILSPSEFLSRPEEISFLIDELERLAATSSDWAARMNLNQIGVVGDSLGGSTALALAGANISFDYLSNACDEEEVILNFALYLQCQVRFLPPQDRALGDERIKAAIATHAVGGALYGPKGMGQIEIPLLMMAGSQDIVAQVVTEQIYPFVWVQSEPKYLALLTKGTHFTAKPGREGGAGFFSLLAGEHRDVGTRYFKALSVAFWRAHLQDQSEYLPYLSASYGDWLSAGEPLALDIVQSLSPETLTAAYGQTPPVAILPDIETAATPSRDEPVLAEIERTGILKVALRQDAAPFGYIDSEANWTGYCREFAADLQSELSQALDQAVEIDLVEQSSTLETRFSLIQDDIVHVECGPNTIRQDIEGVTFSLPLLITGTQFLVQEDGADLDVVNARLEETRVAILPATTNEQYVRETFPAAELIPFDGPTGRSDAIKALSNGQVDIFASDGVLSIAEVLRQNRSLKDYALVPEQPLTCEFYGLVLPDDDPDWQTLINQFITRTHDQRLQSYLPANTLTEQLTTLDYCLNRQEIEQ